MAIKSNLTIDQGSDFSATVDVLASDGQLFDLTGYTARSQIRKNFVTSTITANFICTHNDDGGKITLELPNAGGEYGPGTNSIEPGRYLYDVEIVSDAATPVVTRVLEGTVTVTGGITKESP